MSASTVDAARLKDHGFTIPRGVIDAQTVQAARAAVEQLHSEVGPAAGIRDPIGQSPVLAAIATSPVIVSMASEILGRPAFVVRSILFDKNPTANWDVSWHQDVTIAVRERIDVHGFGPWSTKLGIPHVQPPTSVLERMLTMRIHLDDCDGRNGALLVVPGTHKTLLDIRSLNTAVCDRNAIQCDVAVGDAILMRPLILHASRKATAISHRRVLHLEFACERLPGGLEWAFGTDPMTRNAC